MSKQLSKKPVLLSALAVLVGVVVFIVVQVAMKGGPTMPAPTSAEQVSDVTVVSVEPGAYAAQVTAWGEARSHYQLALTAQVSGRVVSLDDAFDSGQRVSAGTVLMRIEASDYRAAVSAAKLSLANARLALLEEERQGEQAKAEWAASGLEGEPDSELVLRGPQLAAAKADVRNAEAALASARKDLANTTLSAPFDALVVERLVAPGGYVQAGSQVATLYSTDRLEVSLPLSAGDWQNLPSLDDVTESNGAVELISVETGTHWPGRIARAERHLDETTRQRALIVALDRPLDASPALLPGTFLEVRVQGRIRDKLWKLPSSSLSQRGEIWYLAADSTLAKFAAKPLFSRDGAIFISVPPALASAPQQVLVQPLNAYLPGMVVNPVKEAASE